MTDTRYRSFSLTPKQERLLRKLLKEAKVKRGETSAWIRKKLGLE